MIPTVLQHTQFIVYDTDHVEFNRFTFTGSEENTSLVGVDVTSANDGTWIVTGFEDREQHQAGTMGWAAAITESGVQWEWTGTHSELAMEARPFASFRVTAAGEMAYLAGTTRTPAGIRRWAQVLDVSSGELISEVLGGPIDDASYDGYATASATRDSNWRWRSGWTEQEGQVTQWLCRETL